MYPPPIPDKLEHINSRIRGASEPEGVRFTPDFCASAPRMFVQQWYDVPAFIALSDQGLADKE